MTDIPEGAVDAAAGELRSHCGELRFVLEAALSYLASTAEGRAYLLRLVLTFEQHALIVRLINEVENVRDKAVALDIDVPPEFPTAALTSLRAALELPTEEPKP